MINLLAQATTVTPPSSGDFWNPANWVPFVNSVGMPGVFALVFFIAILWMWKTGMGEWKAHLEESRGLLRSQVVLCRQVHGTGGTANVSDFRDAASDLLDAAQDIADGIGKETGIAVKPKLAAARQKIRNQPAPLPALNLNTGGEG
jgi:hypothetical protein